MGLLSSKRAASVLAAGASAAALAAAVAPGSASAACTTITGSGATLQTVAQGIWIGNTSGCRGITYTPTSSGTGRRAFGANGGTLTADAYIGTDEAPTASEITQIKAAVSNSSSIEVVPVAQAAVAVVVNTPSSCTPRVNPLVATAAQIGRAYTTTGTAPTWEDIFPNQFTAACNVAVASTFARSLDSGTTLNFKNYLINTGATLTLSGAASWPGTNVRTTATSGGNMVDLVNSTDGSIGYANLADAVGRRINGSSASAGAYWVNLPNSSGSASPQVTLGSGDTQSNCSAARYASNPTTTTDADWSGVLPGAPSGTTTYPICAITYDVAYSADYSTISGRPAGTYTFNTGDTVRNYLTYVTGLLTGQAIIARRDYYSLPSAIRTIAATGAANVG